MTTEMTASRLRSAGPLAWVVAATAIIQVIAPAITFNGLGGSPGSGAGPDLLITPVGWAFSIWGVIYTLAIAQAVVALTVDGAQVSRAQQIGQIVLYLGATLWIVMAGLDSSVATACALAVMFVAAIMLVIETAPRIHDDGWPAKLNLAAVGLYAGWVTAAFFLNISTALVDQGVLDADVVGWQIGMLAVATLTLVVLLVRSGGNLAYAAAGAWALLGITVTGLSDGTTAVAIAAPIAVVVLLGTLVVSTVADDG
ncbi:MAG TPA: hypothetical protein VNZ66_08625 [Aeromicrobium sp.]|nr:hypothetical protein [Aeromicrobium sp.]